MSNRRDLWHLRHWLQYWQLRTWIHDNLCYLTINCDTGQPSQFLRCFLLSIRNFFLSIRYILLPIRYFLLFIKKFFAVYTVFFAVYKVSCLWYFVFSIRYFVLSVRHFTLSRHFILLCCMTHGAILYPYTAKRRDVLGNTPPRPERFPKGGDFAPRGPSNFQYKMLCSVLLLKSVLEVGFNFSTWVLKLNLRAWFI